MGIVGSFIAWENKLKILVLKYIVCILHIPVLAAELHSSQTTAHPFQLLQDLLVSSMSANVLLSFEQLFPYRFVQVLWPYKTVINYFSEKAASYIKTHTHTLNPFLKSLSILASNATITFLLHYARDHVIE